MSPTPRLDAYLKRHAKRLAGRYVVVVGDEIVGAGSDLERYLEEARRRFPRRLPRVIKPQDPRRLAVYAARART